MDDIIKVLNNHVTCRIDVGLVECQKDGKVIKKWFLNSCFIAPAICTDENESS
eukprot:Pgem_evm1s15652